MLVSRTRPWHDHWVRSADREARLGAMADDSASMLGRFARRAKSDANTTDYGLLIAQMHGGKPDAPTVGDTIPAPSSRTVAVPHLTHPGEEREQWAR